MKLLFSRGAEEEIDGAAEWYNEQRAGLGEEFLESLDSLFASMAAMPESFAPVDDYAGQRRFRQAILRRFPYKVIFEVTPDDTLRVLVVAHTSRAPNYWHPRAE